MPNWKMETVTAESAARLPESEYYCMGGWLLVLVIWMAIQCVNMLATCAVLARGLILRGGSLSGGVALLLAIYLVPALLLAATLTLLLMRKYAFRILVAVYALLLIVFAVINIIENPGWAIAPHAFVTPLFAAWIVYFFTSDRVRVYCNRLPKRPVPMPASETTAHWDASGLVYTDEKGNLTDFTEGDATGTYRFINLPSGWRMTARRRQSKEDSLCK